MSQTQLHNLPDHKALKVKVPFQARGNRAIPTEDTSCMSFDVMEEGMPCDYCGQPVGFMDDNEAVCPSCRAEYINMDFEGGDLDSQSPLEY